MLPGPDPTVPAIGVHKAEEMMADGAILVDIREADEWQAARIPGAIVPRSSRPTRQVMKPQRAPRRSRDLPNSP